MEEEKNYTINWVGLFIKVIVFVVVVLLAIWLITKLFRKDKGLTYEENLDLFKNSAVEYFKKNLPEGNEKLSVTLGQLISWDYLEDELTDEEGKVCDEKRSKATIEQIDDYYSIKLEFICGDESSTNYIKLGNEKCSACDIKVKGLEVGSKKEEENKQEENNQEENKTSVNNNINPNETSKGVSTHSSNNNSKNEESNNNNSNTSQGNNQKILYEYVKETNEYSDWFVGKVKGENIENSTKKVSYSKYCKVQKSDYYTLSYVSSAINYNYTLELKNATSKVTISNSNYFKTLSDYQTYINERDKNLSMVDVNKNDIINITNATTLKNSSLTSNNFTFTVSNSYNKSGSYYVDINVKVKNLSGVTPYYSSSLKRNVYFIPIKFTGSYINENNCITDKTENKNKYKDYEIVNTWNENVDIYRYKKTIVEYKYSNLEYLEGYRKTGKTKVVG